MRKAKSGLSVNGYPSHFPPARNPLEEIEWIGNSDFDFVDFTLETAQKKAIFVISPDRP